MPAWNSSYISCALHHVSIVHYSLQGWQAVYGICHNHMLFSLWQSFWSLSGVFCKAVTLYPFIYDVSFSHFGSSPKQLYNQSSRVGPFWTPFCCIMHPYLYLRVCQCLHIECCQEPEQTFWLFLRHFWHHILWHTAPHSVHITWAPHSVHITRTASMFLITTLSTRSCASAYLIKSDVTLSLLYFTFAVSNLYSRLKQIP